MGDVNLELGQRWVTEHSHGPFVAKYVSHERWIEASNGSGTYGADYLASYGTLLAPAPKPRQRWENGPYADVQIVDADGQLAVEHWHCGDVLFRGSVVDVAKWLAERNYRHVSDLRTFSGALVYVNGELAGCAESVGGQYKFTLHALPPGQHMISMTTNEHLDPERSIRLPNEFFDLASLACHPLPHREPDIAPMASLAAAAAQVFTAPTREDSRRYVDMAVRALRGEPFAKAIQATLVSLVGDRISTFPSPNEIMATVVACQSWEHARGQVAPGKRTLSRSETRELMEVASLAAWTRVNRRDACDIAEIVAETYERVRSVC